MFLVQSISQYLTDNYVKLGLSLMKLGSVEQSINPLLKGYELALQNHSPSAASICQSILEAKKLKFEVSNPQL